MRRAVSGDGEPTVNEPSNPTCSLWMGTLVLAAASALISACGPQDGGNAAQTPPPAQAAPVVAQLPVQAPAPVVVEAPAPAATPAPAPVVKPAPVHVAKPAPAAKPTPVRSAEPAP